MFGRQIIPFLNEAGADAGAGTDAGGMNSLFSTVIMIVLFGALIYFMMYRPQKKQEKAVNEMRNNLKVGDEISTTGGILGKIIQIKDDFLIVETGADRTKLKITKWAVRAVEHREEEEEDEDEDDE